MNEQITVEAVNPDLVSPARMNVSVEFSLLSAQLSGVIEKNDSDVEFLVMPQQNGGSDNLLLSSMVDGINELFVKMTDSDEFKLDAMEIFEKIKEFVSEIVFNALKVSIKQVFLHLLKPKEGKVQLEYAFSVEIYLTDEKKPADTSYAKLESITFGIWNTNNKKIIEKMGLLDISAQLG